MQVLRFTIHTLFYFYWFQKTLNQSLIFIKICTQQLFYKQKLFNRTRNADKSKQINVSVNKAFFPLISVTAHNI